MTGDRHQLLWSEKFRPRSRGHVHQAPSACRSMQPSASLAAALIPSNSEGLPVTWTRRFAPGSFWLVARIHSGKHGTRFDPSRDQLETSSQTSVPVRLSYKDTLSHGSACAGMDRTCQVGHGHPGPFRRLESFFQN